MDSDQSQYERSPLADYLGKPYRWWWRDHYGLDHRAEYATISGSMTVQQTVTFNGPFLANNNVTLNDATNEVTTVVGTLAAQQTVTIAGNVSISGGLVLTGTPTGLRKSKAIEISRNLASASLSVSYTGVGFTPTSLDVKTFVSAQTGSS